MVRLRLVTAVTLAASTLVAATACSAGPDRGGAGPGSPAPASSAAPASASGTASATATRITPTATATIPGGRAGDALRWAVGQVGADDVDVDLARRFTPQFRQQVPPPQVLMVFGQLRGQAPWTVESARATRDEAAATLVPASGNRMTLSLTLDAAGLIDGMLVRPAASGERATDWPGVVRRARLAARDTAIYAADVDADGRLTSVFAAGGDEPRPTASMFKVYVLIAVTDAVAAGRLSWDQQLTLTKADRSLPSGTLQDRPDGTRITVRQAATQMIAISDNTATDLLMRHVGSTALAEAVASAGNRHPQGLDPFLTTRHLFWLGWGSSPTAQAARKAWPTAGVEQRRALAATFDPAAEPNPPVSAVDLSRPQWQQGIEWFASPTDIARAHVHLQRLARTRAGAPLPAILDKPGPTFPGWGRTAFKGGGDAGVITLSYFGRSGGGGLRGRVLVLMGRDSRAVDEATAFAAASDAAALMVRR